MSVQSFPPVLPNSDCKCIVVVREENGRLFKIEKVVKDIFRDVLAPGGKFPVGSVVMVGFLSHLGQYGLESYTTDLVKTNSSMLVLVGVGADIIPFVPVPQGGVDDPDLVRALYDLDTWICAGPGVSLVGPREVFWDVVANRLVGGEPASLSGRTYHLPGGVRNPRRRASGRRPSSPPCQTGFHQ